MRAKVRIKLNHDLRSSLVGLLTTTLLLAIPLAYLLWNHRMAAASSPYWQRPDAHNVPESASNIIHRYYLTPNPYPGGSADAVCASGYHFASLWEIEDPSNLKYNPDIGYTRDDSVKGPPSGTSGWVRTGYDNGLSSTTPGIANCRNWSSSSDADDGTAASLPTDWVLGGEFGVWMVYTRDCDFERRVWCVEDYYTHNLHLPLVLKH